MEQKACAVTGERPTRFRFKYNETYSLCKKIKKAMLEQFRFLHDEEQVVRYYVGGSLGVDMWAGELILRLKEEAGYGDIELFIVLPFEGHDAKWDERSRKRMDFLRRHSKRCITIGRQDCRESYVKRNCYMVDHIGYLVAVCEQRSGMALQTVAYARELERKICFIDPDTAKVNREYE